MQLKSMSWVELTIRDESVNMKSFLFSQVSVRLCQLCPWLFGRSFSVDVIVNTGSAGAVAEGIAIGDVVVANQLAYHDVDVTAFGYAYGQMAGQELYYPADQVLLEQLRTVLAEQEMISHVGLIVTGDSFIAGQERIATIKTHFPEVLAVEMEGAAIAQAAVNTGKPFLVIRAMSDTAQEMPISPLMNLSFKQENVLPRP